MIWDLVAGQEEVVSQLKKAISNREMSHAYLFIGSKGVGKQLAAKVIASVVNCPEGGCGICTVCHKIQNDLHPDVMLIEPEGNSFIIDQVRELQREINLKSFEAKTKFYILDEVDKMTAAAANALLKTLEEPPPHVVFVLLTSNLDSLLPTIVSRCQVTRFKPISTSNLVGLLVSRYQVDEVEAELFARLSGGVLAKALRYAESDRRLVLRKHVLNVVENISKWDGADLTDAAEQIVSEIKKPLEDLKKGQAEELEEAKELAIDSTHATRLKNWLSRKHKRKLNREEKESYQEMLTFFYSWYRDLMVLKETSNPRLLINLDCQDLLEGYTGRISSLEAQMAIGTIQKTEECLRYNINPQLALETMLLELKNLS